MSNSQLTNSDFARVFRPWHPPITKVMQISFRDVLAGIAIHGIYTPAERANVFHAAARRNFQKMCDASGGFFQLVEDGGLDYVALDTGNVRAAFRWPKYDGVKVNRNNTERQKFIRKFGVIEDQGTLFGDMDEKMQAKSQEPQQISVVSCAYTIEDDYTEGGKPCWFMGKIALLRERIDSSEFIENIQVFEKPAQRDPVLLEESLRVVAREKEIDELQDIVEKIRRKTG
jgi:hypothetical protein